jgi:ubiquinone/menaquinone biosynthesis C-methylase UbiE
MPFADRSIDFVVASHIAEHVDDPVRFCAELQRVAKAGYIETPGPLTEYLMPTRSHKWIVWKRGTTIVFKKNPWSRSAFPSFFRFFYLNRDGYVENTMRSDHAVVKAMNVLLLKLWSHIPYAYMKCDWSNGISCVVVGEQPEDAASQ